MYEGSSGTPLQDTNTCAGSLSVAGLKHRGQKQLPEEFILAYGSRESIMTDYLLPAQEAEQQQEVGKVINSQGLPPVMDFLHQNSVTAGDFHYMSLCGNMSLSSHDTCQSTALLFPFRMTANIPCPITSIGAVLRRVPASILHW